MRGSLGIRRGAPDPEGWRGQSMWRAAERVKEGNKTGGEFLRDSDKESDTNKSSYISTLAGFSRNTRVNRWEHAK